MPGPFLWGISDRHPRNLAGVRPAQFRKLPRRPRDPAASACSLSRKHQPGHSGCAEAGHRLGGTREGRATEIDGSPSRSMAPHRYDAIEQSPKAVPRSRYSFGSTASDAEALDAAATGGGTTKCLAWILGRGDQTARRSTPQGVVSQRNDAERPPRGLLTIPPFLGIRRCSARFRAAKRASDHNPAAGTIHTVAGIVEGMSHDFESPCKREPRSSGSARPSLASATFDPDLSRSLMDQPPATGERRMKVSPLDLRQLRFRTAFRGFDRAEVVALIAEVADDYENALREVDKLRQEVRNGDSSPASRARAQPRDQLRLRSGCRTNPATADVQARRFSRSQGYRISCSRRPGAPEDVSGNRG